MFASPMKTEYTAMAADAQCQFACARRQAPARTSTQTMCHTSSQANAATNISLLQTGVIASVSLCVLLLFPGNLLVVSLVGLTLLLCLVGLISLTGLLSLRGLTGLALSLVGRIQGLSTRTTVGD
jgi:hypothetical protein